MTEATPLLNQKCDVLPYDATSKSKNDEEGKEEPPGKIPVYEAESEIPLFDIVNALFEEWRRIGAHADFSPSDIVAMHLQYRRVTAGRKVFHAQHAIMNELADAMVRTIWERRTLFDIDDPHAIQLRHNILRNLHENWQSIIRLDENLTRNLNAYHPPTYREEIQNIWMNCIRTSNALHSFFSQFIGQLLLIIILLVWPLSLLIMGFKFLSQCQVNHFLPYDMLAIGLTGITALLLRLVVASIEQWYWFPMQTVISSLWNALKILEFVFLFTQIMQLWFFFGHSPSFDSNDSYFCNETFYSFMVWMKHISTAFAVAWLAVYFVKAVFWLTRRRYQYMPIFESV